MTKPSIAVGRNEEEMMRDIQSSIQNLSFDEQVEFVMKMTAEQDGMMKRQQQQPKTVDQMTYEEQIKHAEEISLRESGRQSFYERHFQELNPAALNGHDHLYHSVSAPDLVPAVNGFASKESNWSSSGSDVGDSGFSSEERELELALKKSVDPSEQHNPEVGALIHAMLLSTGGNSPLEELPKADNSSLYLYEDAKAIQARNDDLLLRRLEQTLTSPSRDSVGLQNVQRFFDAAKANEPANSLVFNNGAIPDVKSLDEVEAEYQKVNRKKKKANKSPNSSSPLPSSAVVVGGPVTWQSSGPKPELGAIPKTVRKVTAASRSPARQNARPDRSPRRISPDSGQAMACDVKPDPPVAKGAYRPIIVDGNNVAYQHGKNDRFSAKGMQIVYEYFVNRFDYSNHDIVIVHKPGGPKTLADLDIIENLYKIDVLIKTPRRHAGQKVIASDDDLFVLNLAKEKNGIVVSLDQFRDAYQRTDDPGIIDVIDNRILQFVFKGDEIIFPNDPMGPRGPTLDQFLRF